MAKTPVKFIVDGLKSREVASFNMTFKQLIDEEGQVTDLPRGGQITLKVKALNDGNCDLLCWMTDPKQVYSGKIEFRDTVSNKLMKTLAFKDAYCVDYEENWADSVKADDLAHWEKITISCREITNGGAMKFKNEWELEVMEGITAIGAAEAPGFIAQTLADIGSVAFSGVGVVQSLADKFK